MFFYTIIAKKVLIVARVKNIKFNKKGLHFLIVYIEDCILENFIVTFLVIKCVCASFKLRTKKTRLFLACLIGSLLATFYPLLNINGFILVAFKLCVGVIITIVAFDSKNFVAKYFAFIFFTALYGGMNILIYYLAYGTLNITDNFPTFVLLGILLLTYYLILLVLSFAKKKLAISNFVYYVKITNDNKEYSIRAFLDSGNSLLDQDSTPIYIINSKLFNRLYKDVTLADILTKNFKTLKNPHYVKSSFASGSGKILVFSVTKVQIMQNGQIINEANDARLGVSYSKFSKTFDCDMLLNICTFA